MRALVLAAVVALAGCRGGPPPVVPAESSEHAFLSAVSKLYPEGSGWWVMGVACADVLGPADECQATVGHGDTLVMVSGLAGGGEKPWANVQRAQQVAPGVLVR